jgi:predicted DNA-binding protein
MRKTSFDIPEDMQRRANIASAACGLSTAAFYRAAIRAALDSFAQYDPAMRTAFDLIAESEQAKVSA